ncbi:hypothetical protein ACFLQL_04070 [Verrucomicrobiota bacterium]
MDGVLPDSMFDKIGSFPWFAPTPDEMKKEAEDMARPKKVEFDSFHSEIYDLTDPERKKCYLKDLSEVLTGIKLKTHFLFNREKQFVAQPEPKWIMFMEWAIFRLIILDAPELPSQGIPDIKKAEERKMPHGLEDLT